MSGFRSQFDKLIIFDVHETLTANFRDICFEPKLTSFNAYEADHLTFNRGPDNREYC